MLRMAIAIVFFLNFSGYIAFAQENFDEKDTNSELDLFENELQNSKNQNKKQISLLNQNKKQSEGLSSLVDLAPFSDVSVIQKRFLPKTGRMQLFGGVTGIVNDPWFSGLGFDAKIDYHITEAWGLELNYFTLNTSERSAAKELQQEHGIEPTSLVTVKNYSGFHLTWTPLYGKMSLSNQRIIPFDILFSLGMGTSKVDNGSGGSTIHFGTGQVFAITKAQAFRWDISLNSVSAQPTNRSAQAFNNFSITAGYSFFFPEANYR